MYLIRAFEELVRNLFPAAIGCNQQPRCAITSDEEMPMLGGFLRRFRWQAIALSCAQAIADVPSRYKKGRRE
jgi:hypothetical protein